MYAYNQVFSRSNIHTKEVLKDLAKFCRAHESTFNADPRLHAMLEGRREVWLKIQEMLNLTIEEVYDLHIIHSTPQKKVMNGSSETSQ